MSTLTTEERDTVVRMACMFIKDNIETVEALTAARDLEGMTLSEENQQRVDAYQGSTALVERLVVERIKEAKAAADEQEREALRKAEYERGFKARHAKVFHKRHGVGKVEDYRPAWDTIGQPEAVYVRFDASVSWMKTAHLEFRTVSLGEVRNGFVWSNGRSRMGGDGPVCHCGEPSFGDSISGQCVSHDKNPEVSV